MMTLRHRPLFNLILLASAGLRLALAWLPVELLIEKAIPDDAFYYFTLARNLSQGLGPVVANNTPTNGFHPLWALTLWPVYRVVADAELAIHLALSLGALFDVLAIYLGYRLLRRLELPPAAGLAFAALYGFYPLAILESVNGLETALSVFFFALTLYLYFGPLRFGQSASLLPYVLFGLAAGLMLLARTDTLFLIVVLSLHALWTNRRTLPGLMPRLAIAGAVAGLLLLPWLWWNWATFGTIVQSSAVAAPKVVQAHIAATAREATSWRQLWDEAYLPPIHSGFVLLYQYGGLPLTIFAAVVILQRVRGARSPSRVLHIPGALWLAVAGALLPLLFHVFVRWYPRNWYFATWAWAAALAGGPGLAAVLVALKSYRLKSLAVGLLALFFALQSVRHWQAGFYPWQRYMLAGARWIATSMPEGALAASFNSGLQTYYGGRPVANLDGVVNWGAIQALDEKRLLSYSQKEGVDYLVDFSFYPLQSFRPFFEPGYQTRFELVTTLSPEYPPYGRLEIYRIAPDPLPGQ